MSQEYNQLYTEAVDDSRKHFTIDIETDLVSSLKSTNIYNTPPEFVMGGIKVGNVNPSVAVITSERVYAQTLAAGIHGGCLIIGHNVCFDLMPLNGHMQDYIGRIFLWDTQLAEYLISGQTKQKQTLKELAQHYGTEWQKDDEVGDKIREGISPKDMPRDLVEDYLRADVETTYEVFTKQLEYMNSPHVRRKQRMNLIEQMRYLATTHLASCQGFAVDLRRASRILSRLDQDVGLLEYGIEQEMSNIFSGVVLPNPASATQWNAILYGGNLKYQVREHTGESYKTGLKAGQPKTKIVSKVLELKGMSDVKPAVKNTSEDTLRHISTATKNKDLRTLLMNLLDLRTLYKERQTYYEGYMEFARRHPRGTINSQYNHVLTPTGRISSSKPNLQNIKGED